MCQIINEFILSSNNTNNKHYLGIDFEFNKVSIVLIVKLKEKIRTTNEIKTSFLFKTIEKKARSSLNFNPFNLEMIPVTPINKTIKRIIKKENF